MELKVYTDYNAMSAAAANMLIDCIRKKPAALLCFATGDTPKLCYQIIAEIAKKDKIDFGKCFIIGLDEWLGVPADNTGSCYHFLQKYLLEPLALLPSQFHLFDSLTTNEKAECERMNKLVEEKGPIDFMVVGVGMNGHIGFNEPGTDLDSMAHVAILDETTRIVGKKYFQNEVPISKGITLGLKQVMQAKTVLMIANGKTKSSVIKRAIEEDIGTPFPASLLRLHKNGILMIDKEAASELQTSQKWQNN
jgi:galactosamine-6-phosphate isomerase